MKRIISDRRNVGQRRWGIENEFPLKDSEGVLVINERRTLSDRRLGNTSLAERLVMFAGMTPLNNE